jgi:hypothetical protein
MTGGESGGGAYLAPLSGNEVLTHDGMEPLCADIIHLQVLGDGRSVNPPAASCGGTNIEADGSASY